ncbi:hypothetical protein RJT34_11351 [Clitoria ternatea]|uniref:Uncharacterized protein n=1 Tax=Clitoria ternatea TaxID=43366 RepID=A0AAN9JLS5_CLITE
MPIVFARFVIFPINTLPSFPLAYPSLPLSVLAYYSTKRNKAMDPPNEEAVLAPDHAEAFATYSEALDLLDHLRMAALVNVANVIFPINTPPSFLLAYPSLPLFVLAYYSAKRNKAMDPPNEETVLAPVRMLKRNAADSFARENHAEAFATYTLDPPNEEAVLDPVRVLKRNAADSFAREDHAKVFATYSEALYLLDHLRMAFFVNVANVIFPINTSPSFLLAYPSLPLSVLTYYYAKRNKVMDSPNEEAVLAPVRVLKRNAADSSKREDNAEAFAMYSEALDLLNHLRNKAMDPPNEEAVLAPVRVLKRNAADSFAREDYAEAFATYSEALDLLDHLWMAAFVNVANEIFPINTSPSFLLAYPSLPFSVLAYYSAKRNKARDPPNEEAVLAPVRVLKRNAADFFTREDHAEAFATYSEALDLLDHLKMSAFVNVANGGFWGFLLLFFSCLCLRSYGSSQRCSCASSYAVLKRNAADSFAIEDDAEAFATYSKALDLLDHLRMAAFVNVANVSSP